MEMKWIHIRDQQPENGRIIIHLDRPATDMYKGTFKDHYYIGMREHVEYCSWEEVWKWSRDNDLPTPDFWWMYAEDFPFPDRKGDEG